MKTATLSTRVDEQLIARLDAFERTTHIERASLVRAAITAALDHYDQKKSLTFPLVVLDTAPPPTSSKTEAKPKR
jgi:hypothetical protein